MALTVDEKWLKDYTARTGKGVKGEGDGRPHPSAAPTAYPEGKPRGTAGASPRPTVEGKPRNKYGNIRVETEDGTFDSKHEARVWEELKIRAKAGKIRAVGRQVTFFLPGGIKYLADFVVWTDDGETQVLDAKSEATKRDKVYRIKKRLMSDTFGIDIKEV